MKRENQRIVITKRLLKEGMLRVLEEKSIDNVSVSELCREAGINRATFYRHYEIPRDVLMEIQKDVYYELRKQVPMPAVPGDIRRAIVQTCDYLEENKELLQILIRNNSDTDFANFVNDVYAEIWEEYGRALPLIKLDREDLRLLALYSAGGSYFVLRGWMLGNVRKTAREVADYVYFLLEKTDWSAILPQHTANFQ